VDDTRHQWVVAPFRSDRHAFGRSGDQWHDVNAHRNLRGCYTGAIAIVRQLVADPGTSILSDLIAPQLLTLLFICPELAKPEFASAEVRKWLTFSAEGNAPSRTLRIAHGLADFLSAYTAYASRSPVCISFENADFADSLDQEFLAVLLRRADPARLKIRLCTSSDQLAEPLHSALKTFASVKYLEPSMPAAMAAIPEAWRIWLRSCASGWAGEWDILLDLSKYRDLSASRPAFANLQEFLNDVIGKLSAATRCTLASEYVQSDCTSDNLLSQYAYSGISEEERWVLHRARTLELEALNQQSLSLGAIPLHYERQRSDATPLLAASKRCMHAAFYNAALDWAVRGQRMLPATDRGQTYCELTRNILFAQLLLNRLDEVEAICAENLTRSKDPALLAHTTYAKAILTARFYEPPRRDYAAARGWIEKSLAFTEAVPPSETRAVNIAFLRNTMALVEMRTGDLATAYQLLCEALQYMAGEAPCKYEAESAILIHNRARLRVKRMQVPEAIADLTTLLQHQPGNGDAYFDRGILHQGLGQHQEALRDFDSAIKWSPPYPEAHFNRAKTLVALGRINESLVDYERVVILVPDHIEALIDRARLFLVGKNLDAARKDVNAALLLSPTDARLLCLYGLLDLEDGSFDRAYESFTKAIEADASLPDAWANRATVLFQQGDLHRACLDLTQALALRADSAAFYNRGRCFEQLRRWMEATEDYSHALKLANGDAQHIQRHLEVCQRAGRHRS